jgi:hypothetical protein
MAFADNANVKGLLERTGQGALPVTLVDGEVAIAGRYPTREDLARWIGFATLPFCEPVAKSACCSGSKCC